MSKIQELGQEMDLLESISFERITFESKSNFTFEEEQSHIRYMFVKNHFYSFKTNFDIEKQVEEIENFVNQIFALLGGSREEDILLAVELCKGFEISLGNFFLQLGYELKSVSYHWMKPSNHEGTDFDSMMYFKGETIDFEKDDKNLEKALQPVRYERRRDDDMHFQRWCMLQNMESIINKLERFDHKIKRALLNNGTPVEELKTL